MANTLSDVSIVVPHLSEVLDVLTLQAGFNSAIVVVSTILLGVAAGTIGTFVLLRNRALMGDTLAHCSLPGIAIAFIVSVLFGIEGKNLLVLLFGACVTGVLGVASVQGLVRYSRLTEDTAMGVVLSTFFGLGVVLLSVIQSLGRGEEGGLHHFIFGQTAAMGSFDAWLMLVVTLLCVLFTIILFKEFRLLCFDEDYAGSQGWSVPTIDFIMMGLVVVVTVIGLQAVGLLLIVALLIIPAAGARFWTNSLKEMVLVSGFIGGLSGYLGSSASAILPRMPAGAVIVLVGGVLFFISLFCAPERGLIVRFISQCLLSLRVSREHLLREIIEAHELQSHRQKDSGVLNYEQSQSEVPLEVQRSIIPTVRQNRPFFIYVLISLLRLQGVLRVKGDLLSLTEKGAVLAKQMVRNHRLWEEYLINFADFSITHVDFSADLVEHVLSPEIVAKLEKYVSKKNAAAVKAVVPPSIHDISELGEV